MDTSPLWTLPTRVTSLLPTVSPVWCEVISIFVWFSPLKPACASLRMVSNPSTRGMSASVHTSNWS